MKRIFHHFEKWEEVPAGMWRDITSGEKKALLAQAITFTGDHALYGQWMRKVLSQWPVSCEHNLSDTGQNRKAWVGHAAACLAINSPEYVTREAWGYLTKEQQDLANNEAEQTIRIWEHNHEAQNHPVYFSMGAPRILGRHSRRSAGTTGEGKPCSLLSSHLPGDHEKRFEPYQPWLIAPQESGVYGS